MFDDRLAVQLLVKYGARPEIRDKENRTPLLTAIGYEATEAISEMMKLGIEVPEQSRVHMENLLSWKWSIMKRPNQP